MQRRTFLSGVAGVGAASGLGVPGTDAIRARAPTIDPLAFDSTASLLDANGDPLADDGLVPVWAESSAANTDSDGNGDAVSYPDGTDVPLVAVDESGAGAVVGIGCPLVPNDTDFVSGNEAFLLNVLDEVVGSGTVRWDDGHGQFYQLDSSGNGGNGPGFAQFEAYAERNGYSLASTTDVAGDLDGADALVITPPKEAFADAETAALADFVASGGALFLLSQSDFRDFDETANTNALAAAVDAGFRFNDDQVVDDANNAGADYVPRTANFNTAEFAAYFDDRDGIDEANALDPAKTYTVDVVDVADGDTVDVQFDDGRVESIRVLGVDTAERKGNGQFERPEEWEGLADRVGLHSVQFGTTCSLLNADGGRLRDDAVVAVWAEESATNTDADGSGDAVDYGERGDVPLLAIDGNVVGVGSMLVDDTLEHDAGRENEELLLNVWDANLGGSGTVLWDETHNRYNGLGGFSTFAGYASENGYDVRATDDVAADLADADAAVLPSTNEPYTDAELDALAGFVADGGTVLLHDRADYKDYDATSDLNAVADALDAAFRFNDDQVVDETNNAGAAFRPTTSRFNPAFDVFAPREGVGADLTVRGEGSPVDRLVFGEGAAPLLDANGDPLEDASTVAVWAEPSATVADGDDDGDAVTYPDGTAVPVVAKDGNVLGFGAPLVADGYDATADNEEFVLNCWTQAIGDGGTVRWDESHGQFHSLDAFSAFAAYAEANGFAVEAGAAIPSDTSDVDALVVTSPGSFSDAELDALSSFVDAGGAVFLHDQDDFNDYDETENLNAIADALGLGFRFDDAQVLDEGNNAGPPFAPTTTNVNDGAFSTLFAKRRGVDDVEDFWDADYPYLAYHAELATTFARDALAGETVDVSFDPNGAAFNDGVTDPFGRVLAYIEYDDGSGSRDTLYNQQLVEEGYARAYASSLSTHEAFQTAEDAARDAGTGVWANSNPNLTPVVRNDGVEALYVPKATVVETTRGRLNGPFAPVRAGRSSSAPGDPLVGIDPSRNLAVLGGLVLDEGYEGAEDFAVDTSEYDNFAFVANVMDGLSDRRGGRVLVEGGHGQFNASAGLSAEDVAYFQRYLEGFDVDLAGVNDVTSDAVDDARALLVSTPLAAFTDAELQALSEFAADGGAVVLATGANASDAQREHLNAIANAFGSPLRLSDTALTDSTSNLAGDASLPVTSNFGPDPWNLRDRFHADGDMACGRVTTTDTVSGELDGWYDSETYTYATDLSDPCQVEVALEGPTDGDFDLYVTRSGRRPTTARYDVAGRTDDASETVVVVDAVADVDELGILVDADDGDGEYALTVTETGA